MPPGPGGLESALVRLPRLFMLLLDPAGVYFADHTAVQRGPVHREAAVFGSGVPGGSRQASEAEIRTFRERRERQGAAPPGPREWSVSEVVTRAVADLQRSGSAVLAGPDGEVRARVLRFWRGDSILEISSRNRQSRARIPRDIDPGKEGILARYLGGFLSGR